MTTVRVIYHREPEGWWADSPDLEGFAAGGETLDDVRTQAAEGLRFYLDQEDVVLDERFPPDLRLVSVSVGTATDGMVLSTEGTAGTTGSPVTPELSVPRQEPITVEARVAEAAPRVTSTEEAWLQPA